MKWSGLKNTLFLFTCLLHVEFAGFRPVPDEAYTHSLQYFYAAFGEGTNPPELTSVGLLDGEQFMFNDTRITTNWTKKMENESVWKSQMEDMRGFRDILQNVFVTAVGQFDQSEGVSTLQWKYGCERDDNGTTRGYSKIGYDGEDFISLDLNTGSWTADNNEAENFINQWKAAGDQAQYWKNYLENECIHLLKTFVSSARETLERKAPPETSVFLKHFSSPPEVVCHATGFFPKAINITWQKDGEDVQEDVELRETLPNQDGSFQKRSVLKVPAEKLQKHNYTCIIQHSSLEKEKVLQVPKDGGSGGELRLKLDGISMGLIFAAVVAVLIAIVYRIVVWRKKKNSASEGDSSSNNSNGLTACLPSACSERGKKEGMEMESLVNKDLNAPTDLKNKRKSFCDPAALPLSQNV